MVSSHRDSLSTANPTRKECATRVGVYSGGPDGKGASFEKLGAAANKLSGIIQDSRVATVQFEPEGKEVSGQQMGSLDKNMSSGLTIADDKGGRYTWLQETRVISRRTSCQIANQGLCH